MKYQLQSPLFSELPAELRRLIYSFALISIEPITDPVIYNTAPDTHQQGPVLGLPLLRTCMRVYEEIDTRQFYRCNRFNFTAHSIAWEFFRRLRKTNRIHLVAAISFQIENAFPGTASQPQKTSHYVEWDHYLTCAALVDERTALCSLHDDMHFREDIHTLPALNLLVLDFAKQQRLASAKVRKHVVLRYMLDWFGEFLISIANSGVEMRVRVLSDDDKVVEITVPSIVYQNVEDKEGRMVPAWEWLCSRVYNTEEDLSSGSGVLSTQHDQ